MISIGIGLFAFVALATGLFDGQTDGKDLGRYADRLLPILLAVFGLGALVAGIAEVVPANQDRAIGLLRSGSLLLRVTFFAILAIIVWGLFSS